MILISKFPKQLGIVSIIVSIFLFMPFLQFVMVSTAIVIFEPEKLDGIGYLSYMAESFTIQYYFNIPAIVLLIFGLWLLRKKK